MVQYTYHRFIREVWYILDLGHVTNHLLIELFFILFFFIQFCSDLWKFLMYYLDKQWKTMSETKKLLQQNPTANLRPSTISLPVMGSLATKTEALNKLHASGTQRLTLLHLKKYWFPYFQWSWMLKWLVFNKRKARQHLKCCCKIHNNIKQHIDNSQSALSFCK